MRAREYVLAAACGIVGVVLGIAVAFVLGERIGPAVVFSIILIGLGGALVVVRYGRLGPFSGELASPRVEMMVRDHIVAEMKRSLRYGHTFSVLAIRHSSKASLDTSAWNEMVRSVDEVIPCRWGITLLLLPETNRDGAVAVYERVAAFSGKPLSAALVVSPDDARTPDEFGACLLDAIRKSASAPGLTSRHAAEAAPHEYAAAS
jgi:hypothetical protein